MYSFTLSRDRVPFHPVEIWTTGSGNRDRDDLWYLVWMVLFDGHSHIGKKGGPGFDQKKIFIFLFNLILPSVDRSHGSNDLDAGSKFTIHQDTSYGFSVYPGAGSGSDLDEICHRIPDIHGPETI